MILALILFGVLGWASFTNYRAGVHGAVIPTIWLVAAAAFAALTILQH